VLLACALFASLLPAAAHASERQRAPVMMSASVEQSVQDFLDQQPGPLKIYRDGKQTAAELMEGVSAYYGVSPRVLLALLEATNKLLSTPAPPDAALRQPFSAVGPDGFGAQIDWAARELRAGMGPYERPPIVSFTDGTTLTLSLQQAPEGVAVQRLLAKGRTAAEWQTVYNGFLDAFQRYFNNQLPAPAPAPTLVSGFLQRPWPAGTRVTHLAYFDHMFPTVDTNHDDNGYVVNYLGQGSVQYDGHDGHDFYFPDQPIGTLILAAADGIAYARTHRGNGVVIVHPGGYETVYWHLDAFSTLFAGKIDTDHGVRVHAGDFLGTSGKTGFVVGSPHLHFEVRHNGREVDPYGWFGPGSDPCAAYSACEASQWLWHANLIGEADFTPPNAAPPDTTPPTATLTVNPRSDLLLLAHLDGSLLQQIGSGSATSSGTPEFMDAKFGQGLWVHGDKQLAFATDKHLDLDSGTIAFWAQLPDHYPGTGSGRNYLLAASAHPDADPVYTGTLALRRDRGPDGRPQWNFWTTPDSGAAGRNDLTAPDTLAPGMHHFAITWSRMTQTKALYIDGTRVASAEHVGLPSNVGDTLQLGCFTPGAGQIGATFDEFAIFNHALDDDEIAALATAAAPLDASQPTMHTSNVPMNLNAVDNAGGIMSMQLGVDGVFSDPEPYTSSASVRLPDKGGSYTVAARLSDRAGNTTTVSATVQLDTASTLFLPLLNQGQQ
jgi:murein DD-endopeptidase MepM/ murein hydrolase activator NlpD